MSWRPGPRGGLFVPRRLRTTVGDLAPFAFSPVEQLLHQLARLARFPVCRARRCRTRLGLGERPLAVGVRPIGAGLDVAGEPLPEPLPFGGLRGRLDAQRRGCPPPRAQALAGGAELDLQALLGLLRRSATTERRGQRLAGGVLGGLPDPQQGLQRV